MICTKRCGLPVHAASGDWLLPMEAFKDSRTMEAFEDWETKGNKHDVIGRMYECYSRCMDKAANELQGKVREQCDVFLGGICAPGVPSSLRLSPSSVPIEACMVCRQISLPRCTRFNRAQSGRNCVHRSASSPSQVALIFDMACVHHPRLPLRTAPRAVKFCNF